MKQFLIIVTVLILGFLMVHQQPVETNLEAGIVEETPALAIVENEEMRVEKALPKGDYLVNDSLYRWDEIHLEWVSVKPAPKAVSPISKPIFAALAATNPNNKPIKIDWDLLMEIEYNLKYYQAFEMKIYAPVFTESLIALDGKEVIIEGFVIPLDENGELVALSANPFASCFFCGKASPASVISLYLKKKKLYKIDDFRKFRGTLKLNYNDPEEYYYILEDAVPKG